MTPRRSAVSRHQSRLSRAAAPKVVAGSPRRRHPGAPVLLATPSITPTRRTAHHEVSGTRRQTPEKISAYNAEYNATHRTERAVGTAAWRAAHAEELPAIRRAFAAAHPEASTEYTRRSRALYPEKVRARKAVEAAIRNGSLACQPCITCGNAKAEAHHPDYAKPLDVIWYCRQHHRAAHRVTGQVESPHPAATLPADVAADLVAGKLEQVCPSCGLREAAGGYCTTCATPTGPADWRRPVASEAKAAALSAARAKRRETSARAAALKKSAPPEPLAGPTDPEPLGLWPA